MKRFIFYYLTLLAALVLLGACSPQDEPIPDSSGGEQTWHVTINASPSGGSRTRALSIGEDKKLYTTWTDGDQVEVVSNSTIVGTLKATIPGTDNTYATLTGTLTGSFAQNDVVNLWYSHAEVNYAGQTGALADVSSTFTFLSASSTVEAVDTENDVLQMTDATFLHQQAFLHLTFTDSEGTQLAVSSLKIAAESGKLVKTIALDGAVAYFTAEDPMEVTPTGEGTSQFFLSLRDEKGSDDVFYFTATVGTKTYMGWANSPLSPGHYYVGTLKLKEGSVVGRDDYESGSWESVGTGTVGRDDYYAGSWDDVGTGNLGRDNYIGGSWDTGMSGRTGRTGYTDDSWDRNGGGRTGRNDYTGDSWDRNGSGNTGRTGYTDDSWDRNGSGNTGRTGYTDDSWDRNGSGNTGRDGYGNGGSWQDDD
ncbi:MAG: hypothetical protein IKH59_05655 [Bacteroidaceae bacterium]|nr:hypothetical protein [Bacteroidaceae bacterium]